ncbi:hypothetical protein WJX77_004938 [Trebouxia sp. C0004]
MRTTLPVLAGAISLLLAQLPSPTAAGSYVYTGLVDPSNNLGAGHDCSSEGYCDGSGVSCVDTSDSTLGTSCTGIPGTTSRCVCTTGPLPENADCSEIYGSYFSEISAPCADGLLCDQAHVGFLGQCVPPDVKVDTESCSKRGSSCQRGLTCLALEAVNNGAVLPFDNYTACVQTVSGDNMCECYPGPIPANGYCFVYGAACKDGYFCDTGRADATGGYCQPVGEVATPQASGLAPGGGPAEAPAEAPAETPAEAPAEAPTEAPAEAPAGAPSGAPSTPVMTTAAPNQGCTSSGNICGNGETCMDMTTNQVCGPNSVTGCQCSSEEIEEGGRCDLYGAPCATASNITCKTTRADSTVGKCASEDLLPSGGDCSATGTYCWPGASCRANAQTQFCSQTAGGKGTCTCAESSIPFNNACEPWGAPCYSTSRCLVNSQGSAYCSGAQTAVPTTEISVPTCSPNGTPGPSAQFCGTGHTCLNTTGSLCSSPDQACTCSATAAAANGVCQLYGAPCAAQTVCRPPRADTTVGFCLPEYWGNTINQAGAGSSYGGVTGPWVGGLQAVGGAGLYTDSGGAKAPPPPPLPTPTATLRPVSKSATKIYTVKATCTLHDIMIADFQQPAYQKQFVATLVTNIETLTGSPASCSVTSFQSGSVVATTQTDFLDNNQGSATTYANVMKSGDPSSVFGTGYGRVSVDPSSVQTSLVSNPAHTGGAAGRSLAAASVSALVIAAILVL